MRRRARIDRGTSSAHARRARHALAATPAPVAPGYDGRGAARDDQDSRFVESTFKQENSIPQSIPCAIPLPGEPSAAVTRLERWINPRCEEHGGRSGFRLLPSGLDAFVARAVLGELLTSFTRVNRRMHNKQFIADGAAVVLGGRNIGDEYFSRGELDFQDVDVLVGGPVAQQSAHSFEAYWTSTYAIPITRLVKFTPDRERFDAARAELGARCDGLRDSEYGRALAGSDLARDLRA